MTYSKLTFVTAIAATAALILPSAAPAADFGAPRVAPRTAYVPAPAANPCYAVFHRHKNGTGRSLERIGPERVAVIRDLRYHNGASLNSRVKSVVTGPGAHIVLYAGKGYRRVIHEAGPDSVINLPLPIMDSYELRCTTLYQPPAYVPTARPRYK